MSAKEGEIGNLTRDLLFQVFLRVPPSTLCVCRCVSKLWRDLIADPLFLNLHSTESTKKPLMVVVDPQAYTETDTYEIILVDPLKPSSTESFLISVPYEDYTIAYCSGFLLFYGREGNINICNPSTRELVALDPPNPCIFSEGFIGFGYLPSKSQHKIVDFVFTSLGSEIEEIGWKALVLTLPGGSIIGSWKTLPVDFYVSQKLPDYMFKPICVGGTIYWWALSYSGAHPSGKVLYFDLETEEFHWIESPFNQRRYDDVFLVELKGIPCLVDALTCETVLNIWALEDKKNGIWAKMCTIDYSNIDGYDQEIPQIGEDPRLLLPLQVVVNEDGEEIMLIVSHYGSFHNYNLKAKTSKKVAQHGTNFFCDFFHRATLLRTTVREFP